MNVGGMSYHGLRGANLLSRLFKKELKRRPTPCPPLDLDARGRLTVLMAYTLLTGAR
jgi:hypothetical protein